MTTINIGVNVHVEDIAESIVYSGHALEIIKQIDLRFAEADFTEGVIKMLVKSLKIDYTTEEMNCLIQELSEI